MRRAEVWWAELPPPVGPRPVVVLTRNAVSDTIGAVVVALVTRTSRGLPTEVSVGKAEGLPRPSVVNTDNILTVPRQRLIRLMGQFSSARINELDRALKIALGLDSGDSFSEACPLGVFPVADSLLPRHLHLRLGKTSWTGLSHPRCPFGGAARPSLGRRGDTAAAPAPDDAADSRCLGVLPRSSRGP